MDDLTMKALTVVLNEKKSEYIKGIDLLKLKEKKLTILKNKLECFFQELFMTFSTMAHVDGIDEEDSEDEDYSGFIMKNNHLINIVKYDTEYMNGFMDCLKSVIISYDKYLTTDNHLTYGEVRQIIVNEINP